METNSENESGDLWQDFIKGDPKDEPPRKPKATAADGNEWVGIYDRRNKPRTNEGNKD